MSVLHWIILPELGWTFNILVAKNLDKIVVETLH